MLNRLSGSARWASASAVSLCALLLMNPFLARGADKSGVSPNTISVPKGPGSIEGLGDSFQPTLNTGTAKYGFGLKVPPGTAGQHPEVHLSYEGGGGNGPLGYGWQISQAGVQRQCDKGIPTYGESLGVDRPDRFLNDAREELVPRGDGFFFCKNEGAFVRYQFVDMHWEATLPDGTRLFFGTSADSRIQDGTNSGKIFNWLLEREVDTRGNTITYSYTNFPGTQDLNQRYISEIRYGPGRPPWDNFHFVKFNYEQRWDWFEDCRPGFAVRTGHRLHSVDVGTQGPLLDGHLQGDFNGDGVPDSLVRRYDLGYLAPVGPPTHGSLLQRITQIGSDGVSTLPPLTLGYSICAPPDRISAAQSEIGSAQEPPVVMDKTFVDLVDLNGDGLPDILVTRDDQVHDAYLNHGVGYDGEKSVLAWSKAKPVFADSVDSLSQRLSAEDTHLADMDGDGRADLVHKISDGSVIYFQNRGTNAWGERRSMAPTLELPPAPFGAGNVNVRTGDFDFDKRTDIIRSDGLSYTIWFNEGDDRYSEGITVPQENPFNFALSTVQFADLNGDRVPDVARLGAAGLEWTLGLGYGRFGPLRTIPIPDLNLTDDLLHRAKLSDITGDGLADLVLERANDGELWYWINLGNATFTTRKVISGLPASLGLQTVIRWADMNGNGTTDLVYADPDAAPKLRTFDLGALLNCGTTPNLLTAISNGIGGVTLIGYSPSTQFLLEDRAQGITWTNGMPFPVTVISSITNLDSLGHSYLTRFRYHDGYYDPVEKQFRGFSRVEQIDVGDDTAPTEVTKSVFDTGRVFEAMKGRLLGLSTETEDGRVFQVESTAWISPPKLLLTGTNGLEVRYAHPVASTRRILELGQGTERWLESEMQYDAFGNQTRHADYGIVENGDRSAFDDERITATQYAINTNAWILRTVAVQELRDENDAVISRSEHFYDDETFSGKNLGLVTIGNLTLKRDWVSPSNSTATVLSARTRYDAYGNPVLLLDPLASAPGGVPDAGRGHWRRIDYDARFHAYPVSETIELGTGKDPLVFRATYDEGFGTVTSSTDFNGNSTRYGYDTFARLVRVLKPGDSQEFPTDEYDYALGVRVGEAGQVNYVETRQLDKAPAEPGTHRDHYFISRAFVDGLGRKLMTRTEAEPAPGTQTPRVAVTEAVQFNARQKPARALNPFFTTRTGDLDTLLAYEPIESPVWKGEFHENGQSAVLDLARAHASRTVYDATLRPVQVFNQDNTFRLTRYEPLVTFSYDENDVDPLSPFHDTPMVHYHDGLDRLVRVDEMARLSDDGLPVQDVRTWNTRYSHDLNDQLTRIVDSQNNLKTFYYDGLKRKIEMQDPDRGQMIFAYDDASNLIQSTDAKGQQITYTYDGANRILTEDYHDEETPFSGGYRFDPASPITPLNRPDVAYFYDSPVPSLDQGDTTTATATNTRGTLAAVWDLAGEEHTSYDARARVSWTVKRIPDPELLSRFSSHVGLVSYKTSFEYDSLDRVTRMTYPDADFIRYEYNERSLLKRIPGGFFPGRTEPGSILSNLVYVASGQTVRIDYGNGVRTTYDYDPRLRLKTLLTVGRDSVNPDLPKEFIHFNYDFDGVSNIRSIEDRRPGSAVPAGDPRRNTQIFQYDDLYRLTRVQYSFHVPTGSPNDLGPTSGVRDDGVIQYRYDRIGNMMAQTSTMDHQEKALPVANLGEMSSGGAAGRWNRSGRGPKDPPGPHALSRITNPKAPVSERDYPYDANGNMLNIDGLQCTWDFKDRLVGVENAEMRAVYTYDYTDRRILKRVWSKTAGKEASRPLTVSYINKFFEVREHDAPTKYVWNGSTRVAKVTGGLNTDIRVQRLRLWPGWNLVSTAVEARQGLAQLASGLAVNPIRAAVLWNRDTKGWDPVLAADTLPPGSVLWLLMSTNATLALSGKYIDTTNRVIQPGGDFVAGAGLEIAEATNDGSGILSPMFWGYDASGGYWIGHAENSVGPQTRWTALSDQEATYTPTQSGSVALRAIEPFLEIVFYHEDHLGSVSICTTSSERNTRARAYFPFGAMRDENDPWGKNSGYGFSQKEQDLESGLHYFESRFLYPSIARFVSVDPLVGNPLHLETPQVQSPFAYVANHPLNHVDPDGRNPVALVMVVYKWADLVIPRLFDLGIAYKYYKLGEAAKDPVVKEMMRDEMLKELGGAAKELGIDLVAGKLADKVTKIPIVKRFANAATKKLDQSLRGAVKRVTTELERRGVGEAISGKQLRNLFKLKTSREWGFKAVESVAETGVKKIAQKGEERVRDSNKDTMGRMP